MMATAPEASAREGNSENSLRAGLGIPAIVAAIVLFVLGWAAVRALRTQPTPTPPPAVASTDEDASYASDSAPSSDFTPPDDSASRAAASSGDANPPARASGPASIRTSKAAAGLSTAPVSPSADETSLAVHEEFPDIPERAKRTIRGTVRVSVRVIVNEDGTVFAALTDNRGPSRYFERLAIEAAKKWTFIPADGASDQRVMLIRFAFSRDNDTASAIALK